MTAQPRGYRLGRPFLALLAAGLAAAAGLAFSGAFSVGSIFGVCLLSAAIPGAIAAAALLPGRDGRNDLPLLACLMACAAAWAVLLPPAAAALAVTGTGAAGSPWRLIGTLANAPKQLLTTVPPAAATAPLLFALGTLVWWSAAWSALAAVSGPAGTGAAQAEVTAGRHPAGEGLLPIGAPALVLLAGTAAGVPAGSASQLWPAAVFTALAAALVLARRALLRPAGGDHGPGRLARAGRGLAGAAVAAVVSGLAVAITAVLPGLASVPPADPRPLVTPPAASAALLDPLSLVSAWLVQPRRPLFTVTTAAPENLSWLVLDTYDGAGWTSDASYLPAGSRLPAGRTAGVPMRPVRDVLRVTGLPGIWLPAAERPAQVSGIAVRVAVDGGMLATYDGSAASGLSYAVTSAVASPGLSDLTGAVPGSGPALAAQLSLPAGLPPAVVRYGLQAEAGAASPYQQMVLLQDRMLADFHFSPAAAPGEGYGHLALFVGGRRVGGPGVFATLFAVLARRAGFPSRIVVGFTPGRRVARDTYQVTTADVLVWPEVYFDKLGWLPFYPLPRPGRAAGKQAVRALGEPAGRSALDRQAARAVPERRTPGGTNARVSVPPSRRGRGAGGAAIAALLALAGLAACGLLVSALLRAVTWRRRRNHRDPRRRVAWAWQYARDGIRRACGVPVAGLTVEEIAALGTELLGPAAVEPLASLAGLVNKALFAPEEPAAADADAAWERALLVRGLARSRTRWRSRIAALLPWDADRAAAAVSGAPDAAGTAAVPATAPSRRPVRRRLSRAGRRPRQAASRRRSSTDDRAASR